MRWSQPLTLAFVLMCASCSDSADSPSSSTAPPATSTAPSETNSNTAIDVTDACSVLAPADFADVGFTVAADGEDVSENFNLSTTSSVACQWMSDDDNISSSWELIVGTGDAEAAYAVELSFLTVDTVTTLEIGDDSYLVDKVSSFDSTDHDYEVGVRIGDTFFTLSTTDDRGVEAVTALAALVADRLTP